MARKIKTHFLSPHGIHNGHSDTHWKGLTLCGVPCGGQLDVALIEPGRRATCRACLRADRKFDRENFIGRSGEE
jgi:hypothetical protein